MVILEIKLDGAWLLVVMEPLLLLEHMIMIIRQFQMKVQHGCINGTVLVGTC